LAAEFWQVTADDECTSNGVLAMCEGNATVLLKLMPR